MVAAFEVLIFRLMWNAVQVHPSTSGGLVLNPLVDLEDLGSILLVLGWLRWFKGKVMRWAPKSTGTSIEPVVGIKSEGSLLLADGGVIPRLPTLKWPKRGVGKSKIVTVIKGPENEEIYVRTEATVTTLLTGLNEVDVQAVAVGVLRLADAAIR